MSAPLPIRRTSRIPRKRRFDDDWVIDQDNVTEEAAESVPAISTPSSQPSTSPLSHTQNLLVDDILPLNVCDQSLNSQAVTTQPIAVIPVIPMSATSIGANGIACAFVLPQRVSDARMTCVHPINSKDVEAVNGPPPSAEKLASPQLDQENRPSCKTYVLFDIETTGLSNADRITELAMVAVHRDDLFSWHYVSKGRRKTMCPRVVNKLSLCVNPQRYIQPKVEQLTGLSNSNLKSQSTFDADLVHVIRLFLQRQSQPVCLIAHNGDRFDFPRLVQEIVTYGGGVDIPNVLAADSLNLFRFLENGKVDPCSSPAGSKCFSFPRYNESYKLADIYKRRTGSKPAVQHGAEADCYTLLALIKIGGTAALNWINENAAPLSKFQKNKKFTSQTNNFTATFTSLPGST